MRGYYGCMYGNLRPLPYRVMCDRLDSAFSVVECGQQDEGFRPPTRTLRLFKMGLGTGEYYNVPFDGNEMIMPEPEIKAILDYFGIGVDEFMDGFAEDK